MSQLENKEETPEMKAEEPLEQLQGETDNAVNLPEPQHTPEPQVKIVKKKKIVKTSDKTSEKTSKKTSEKTKEKIKEKTSEKRSEKRSDDECENSTPNGQLEDGEVPSPSNDQHVVVEDERENDDSRQESSQSVEENKTTDEAEYCRSAVIDSDNEFENSFYEDKSDDLAEYVVVVPADLEGYRAELIIEHAREAVSVQSRIVGAVRSFISSFW